LPTGFFSTGFLPFYDTHKFLHAAALPEASVEDLTGQIAALKGKAACSSFLLFEPTGFFYLTLFVRNYS
jgi:hypothetical protein